MLRTACRRTWASLSKSVADRSTVPPLRNSSGDLISRGLGLGFSGGSSVQPVRTFVAGVPSNLFSCVAKETFQSANNAPSKFGSRHGSVPPHFIQVRGFIQLKTNLEVADNSGARRVQCIKVMKGSNAAQIGDIIMASVKEAQPRGKVKKGDVVTCVVVRAATQKLRRDGSEIRFDKNAVVIVNKQGEPVGTRIFGTVPHELRRRKLVKILTLAEHVV